MAIEREITYLDFDGAAFKRGIDGSLKDMARLKKGLQLDNAVKGINQLDTASRKLNFNSFADSIGTVTSKLSTMGSIGFTVVNRIVNAVIDGTTRMFQSLVTGPMSQGLDEYETQMNAIQTILANTSNKGTVLSDVNTALDELNLYADRTIYNFTNMTDSIGKFTAAGVDLETSVGAIKGIANLAAVSGSNSQQASTAMYQLSQAISSGTLKLQDWNSVVNAGMGGEIFQEALKETARVHGVAVDDIIEKNGGFRNSLQEGWISSTILLETLEQFTGDLTDSQLRSMGYTEQQIEGIVKMGQMANAAATDIKTLSQLKDTAAEAMQSGWSQTWRIIFGDFEEAKALFTTISGVLDNLIGSSADARNNFFQQWADMGGRDQAILALTNGIQGIINVINNFKMAVRDVFKPLKADELYLITNRLATLMVRFNQGTIGAYRFKSVIRGLASVFGIAKSFLLALIKPLFDLEDGMFSMADTFINMMAAGGDWLYNLNNMIIDTDFFGRVLEKVWSWLLKGRDTLMEIGRAHV